jgi:hypothetical protein
MCRISAMSLKNTLAYDLLSTLQLAPTLRQNQNCYKFGEKGFTGVDVVSLCTMPVYLLLSFKDALTDSRDEPPGPKEWIMKLSPEVAHVRAIIAAAHKEAQSVLAPLKMRA